MLLCSVGLFLVSCHNNQVVELYIPENDSSDYYSSYLKPQLVEDFLIIPTSNAGKELLKKNLIIQNTIINICEENINNWNNPDWNQTGKAYQKKVLKFNEDGTFSIEFDNKVRLDFDPDSIFAKDDGDVEYPDIVPDYERNTIVYVKKLNKIFLLAMEQLDKNIIFPVIE